MNRMVPRTVSILALVAALPLRVAWAHDTGHPAIYGLITDVETHFITVQTMNGPVNVAIGDGTFVMRRVIGSTADLHKGQIITVQMTHNGGAVTSIEISPPTTWVPGQPRPVFGSPPSRGQRQPDARQGPRSHTNSPLQIQSWNNSTLTARTIDGHTATFNVDQSVTVLKDLRGQLSDLAFGETVNVFLRKHANGAACIYILFS